MKARTSPHLTTPTAIPRIADSDIGYPRGSGVGTHEIGRVLTAWIAARKADR
jgi:hypothetical protein